MLNPAAKRTVAITTLTSLSLACAALLSACGGGSSASAPLAAAAPAAPASSASAPAKALAGTVAVGAPITSGKLRVLDATGAVVAADVTIDANGKYADVTLTGPAPYRIEACGYAGPNYVCVYSVASEGGTANVTPLTTATVLLAAGKAPDSLMTGTAPTLTTDTVATAQTQLRTSLASVLTSAGVSASIDFVSADLTAGSRTGHDGVLDAIGVSVGQDTKPFVQITPRIGTGNLYLEQGSTSGTVTASSGAATLQLGGLETLFKGMSDAFVSASACSNANTGIGKFLAAQARMSMGDGDAALGAAKVAEGLCGFFASGEDGKPMWGAKLLSPTLGRCDLSGASPVCAVSFVMQGLDGDVHPVGKGMAVTQEGGAWKFVGDTSPIEIHASAKAQRSKRIDTATPVHDYSRALAFEVAAVSGLACAKVSQKNADGATVPIGYYKRHPGATDQRRLALWTADGMGWGPSLDPLVGATRNADDSWIGLPEGAAGDAMIRNFYRGGRSVNVALYSDSACSTPFVIGGKSSFEVDVDGVPPVWAAMETLPWPELDTASLTALRDLTIAAGADGSLSTAWTFARGPLGVDGSTVCGSRDTCGEGDTGRLGEKQLRPSARSAAVSLHNRGGAIARDDQKTFALYGRNGEGVDLQSNYSSCPGSAAGEACH
ncbi:hypothetical protein [Roseateles sp.]|uniref:hypothetical protein n=1 Tax=Roseateles sp. TaxID=1971397 RepID=UPI003267F0A8